MCVRTKPLYPSTVVLLGCIQVNDVHVFPCFSARIRLRNVTGPKQKKKKKIMKNDRNLLCITL